jgi:FAD/FMN-containing dehydrogenase
MSMMTARTSALSEESLVNFKTRFGGKVVVPTDAKYDKARALWNGIVDKKPYLIAQCKDAQDVMNALTFAREASLTVAVRAGGHNVAGLASVDGGIVIDLSQMSAVEVDPEKRLVRVEGGATWADVDKATQAFGLATPGGLVSTTGVAGLTLGGGMGWLRRKHGLSCDNLAAADVVTAEGNLVSTSETENSDLLWGLRGGGGNFGIVTSFEFNLHQVGPEVAFVYALYPLQDAKRVLRAHETFLRDEPGDISTVAVMGRVPHIDAFPEDIHGASFVAILGMHAGPAERGMEAMRPLRELVEPIIDMSGPMPYVDVQQIYDADYPNGSRYYWKSTSLNDLSDEVVDILVNYAELAPADHSTIDIWYHGGAIVEQGEEATAFGRRDIPYLVNPEANWEDPADDEANIAWARNLLKDLKPHSEAALYLNFPGFLEEGDELMKAAFGGNYRRLVELKNKYDPQNLFKMNHNIKPEST